MKSNANVLILYVRYGYEDYPGAANSLINHFRKITNNLSFIGIENNNYEKLINSQTINGNFIYGNNKFNEFSAWSMELKGLDEKKFDIVVLATSSYKKNYRGGNWNILENISKTSLDFLLDNKNYVVGQIDRSDKQLRIWNEKFETWLRTSLILIPVKIFDNFSLYPDDIYTSEKNISVEYIFDVVKSSENYRDYVLRWLNGEIINGGSWSTVYSMSADQKKKKIIMIIFEHLLSIRLRKAGVKILDIYTAENLIDQYFINNFSEMEQIDLRRSVHPDS